MKFIKVGNYVINPFFITYMELNLLDFPNVASIHVQKEVYKALKAREYDVASLTPTSNSVLDKQLLPG